MWFYIFIEEGEILLNSRAFKLFLSLNFAAVIFVSFASLACAKTETVRIGENDWHETTVEISKKGWIDTSDTAVLATGHDFPDALGAAPLAKKYNAPILLTDKDYLTRQVIDELKRLKVKTVYITGGEGAVSRAVEDQLASMDIIPIRLAGSDRYETNIKIVDHLSVNKGTPVIIVNGYNFPDAVSVSSISGIKGYPILIVDKGRIPEKVGEKIRSIQPSKVFLIGGEGVLEGSIINDIKSLTSLEDTNVVRIWGNDRYETSINLCKYFDIPDISKDTAVLAGGEDFQGALSGGALAIKLNTHILLVDRVNILKQKEYLDASGCSKAVLIGGTGSIGTNGEGILNNTVTCIPGIYESDGKGLTVNSVIEKTVGTRINDRDNGSWWGENIVKAVRKNNMSYTFTMDSESGTRQAYLYEKKDGDEWIEGEPLIVSRPPGILIDSQNHIHIIGFELFDNTDENAGRIFHVRFDNPNTVKGTYTKTYLTEADQRKGNLTLENYGTYYCGAAMGTDDTILAAYNNSTRYNVPGTNSLGVRIYNPGEDKWSYETVCRDMKSRYCYPFAFVSEKYYHVYAVEDDPDSDFGNLGEPYSNYQFRYGAVKHFQRLKTGGEWVETTLIDFNDKPGISKKDIFEIQLRVIDFYIDSKGIVHALIKYMGSYDGDKLSKSNINKCYHYWKPEDSSIWNVEQVCEGYNFNWVRIWERSDKSLFLILSNWDGTIQATPFGTSARYLLYRTDSQGPAPFICGTRSGSPLSPELFMVIYYQGKAMEAKSLEIK